MIETPAQTSRGPFSTGPALFFGLLVVVLLAYVRALNGQFVWDDDAHVTAPALRSLGGLWRIWFEVGATQQYYPLLHTAFWLEHLLWGDAPLGYHLVNVTLHASAAGMFGLALRRLGVPGATWAALIFAVHPVHVESVAWISELKNTLSAVFYLGALLLYLRFDAERKRSLYGLAFLLFVLALLTKTVTATLPAALLVIQWWRRGRLSWRADAVPLLPWFLVGAVAGLFTAWVERTLIGAEGVVFELSLSQRCLLAGRVVWFYLGKLLWPADLAFIYPRWAIAPSDLLQWLPLAGAAVVLALLWRRRAQQRGPLAALLLFGGTLFPVLGFFNVYPFRYSFVADHFQYLASLAIIAGAGAGLAWVVGRWRPWGRVGAVTLVLALGILTARQAASFRDRETLWRTTVARSPNATMAWVHWGAELARQGRHEEAILRFTRALQTTMTAWDAADAHNNLGCELMLAGKFPEALGHLEKAVALNPPNAEVQNNLGYTLRGLGRRPEAIRNYERALQLKPNYADAHNNLGVALAESERPAEAVTHYARALALAPGHADAHHNRGNALRMLGRLPEAIGDYEAALRQQPGRAETHDDLGVALLAGGRVPEALAQFSEALRLKPTLGSARRNLAVALAESGRPGEALPHFEAAVRAAPQVAGSHLDLGAALSVLNRWPEAAVAFARAVGLQPEAAEAHQKLAMALANTNRMAEAVTHFETALRLDPRSAETHTYFAQILRALGREREAAEHLARAAALQNTPR